MKKKLAALQESTSNLVNSSSVMWTVRLWVQIPAWCSTDLSAAAASGRCRAACGLELPASAARRSRFSTDAHSAAVVCIYFMYLYFSSVTVISHTGMLQYQ